MLSLLGWLSRPDLHSESLPSYSAAELRAAESLRDVSIDTNNAPVLWQDVNYEEGVSASWWPRAESPVLKRLVADGRLPPVAERVGPEPCVMKGCDGVGTYGGTWIRANDILVSSRMSYATLVRFSPQGFPIVPHLAKKWEISDDNTAFTFYLRRGVKWSDGHPFTVRDIEYWWKQEQQCEALTGTTIHDIMVVNGLPGDVIAYSNDLYKVTFAFPEPNGIFLAKMATYAGAFPVGSPSHYLRQFHPELGDTNLIARAMRAAQLPSARSVYTHMKHETNPYHPRMWPWVRRAYQPNAPFTAVRNPFYYVVDTDGNQLPYMDRIMSEEMQQELVPIRAANGGITVQSRYIAYDQYTYLMSERANGGYEVFHWYSGDRSAFVIQPNLNRRTSEAEPASIQKRALMRDKRFRQALSLAINRAEIIDAEYNGHAEPAQVAPGRESPFFDEKALKSYADYDPRRANVLLDELGLNRRDIEGCRTFADGNRMTFYLDYTKGYTSDRPVQFVVDDWRDVGVRVVPRQRQRTLFDVERAGLLHDFNVWGANGEHYPIIQPRFFAPVENCYFALAYAKWYMRGGMRGDAGADHAGCEAIPQDHPLYAALDCYLRAARSSDLSQQRTAFSDALAIAAENVWSLNLSTPPPLLLIVKNGVRNVPKTAVYSWDFQSPGNAGIETFYMEKSNDSPGAVEEITQTIHTPVPRPSDLALGGLGTGSEPVLVRAIPPGAHVATTIRGLLAGVLVIVLLLISIRHPYIGRRLLIMGPTLLIISVVTFVVIQLPPGDYLTSKIMELEERGDTADLQEIEEIKQLFFLAEPMPVRYAHWLGLKWFVTYDDIDRGLLQGNLGRSMETGGLVNEIVGDRLLLTICISVGTVLFTWALALPIGIYSAVRQYSAGDYVATMIGFVGMCVPPFLLALLLMYFARVKFGVSITGLLSSEFATQPEWTLPKVLDLLKHIWLPIVVLGVGGTAGMIRVMRANLLDELKKPYVTTARAKGVRPVKLLMKYPVRLALNPFVSGIGGLFPMLVSGGAIVAMVLSLPTVGPLMLNSLMNEDMYLAGSMLMVLSLLGIVGTLVSDLLLLALDPRIRYERRSK